MTIQHLEGLIAAPYTAMHADGSLNLDVVERQAEALVASGVSGAFVCGTTGESLSLTVAERMAVVERWRAVAPRDFCVVAHVGHTAIADARAIAAHAQEVGVTAIAAMAPCFFKPATVADLVDFCAEVAAAAPRLPFYYYQIPSMTGVSMPVLDFLTAAAGKIPTLAGAKFTYENLMDYFACLRLDGGRYDLLIGRDELLLAGLALGAKGAVGTIYGFAAPVFLRVIGAFDAGDLATARAEQARANELIAVFVKFGGLPAGKAIMRMIGQDCGPARPPLRNLTEEQCAALRAELDRIGFFGYCNRLLA